MSATAWIVLCAVIFGPWLVPCIWLWRTRPRDGWMPPSMGEQIRNRQ